MSERQCPYDGIINFTGRTTAVLSLLFEEQQEGNLEKKRDLTRHQSAGALILNFQALTTVRNKFLLLISHPAHLYQPELTKTVSILDSSLLFCINRVHNWKQENPLGLFFHLYFFVITLNLWKNNKTSTNNIMTPRFSVS